MRWKMNKKERIGYKNKCRGHQILGQQVGEKFIKDLVICVFN